MTVTDGLILISPEEIPNSSVENEHPSRRAEIKVRKNEIKLRKNEIKVPMNFSVPHWIIKDLHRGISDSLHKDVDALIVI